MSPFWFIVWLFVYWAIDAWHIICQQTSLNVNLFRWYFRSLGLTFCLCCLSACLCWISSIIWWSYITTCFPVAIFTSTSFSTRQTSFFQAAFSMVTALATLKFTLEVPWRCCVSRVVLDARSGKRKKDCCLAFRSQRSRVLRTCVGIGTFFDVILPLPIHFPESPFHSS